MRESNLKVFGKDQDQYLSSANELKNSEGYFQYFLGISFDKYMLNQWLITTTRLIVQVCVVQGEPTEYTELDWEIIVLLSNRIRVFPAD